MEESSLSPISSKKEITGAWLEQVLSQKLGCSTKILTWSARTPETKSGYLSEICFVKVSFTTSEDPVKERSLVVKFMPEDEETKAIVKDCNLARREVEFYKYAYSEDFRVFCQNSGLPRPVPEVYWAGLNEDNLTIVLHDLCTDYFRLSVPHEGNSVKQIRCTFAAIAVIHGAGIAIIRKSGKPMLNIPLHYTDLNKIIVSGINLQLKMFEGTPIVSTLKSLLSRVPDLASAGKKYPLVETMIHGDLWTGNVMFSEEDDEASIFDWQFAQLGNPVCDLVSLLMLNAETSVLNEHLTEVQECYWNSLQHSLKMNDVPIDITFQDLVNNMESLWIFGYMYLTASLSDIIGKHVKKARLWNTLSFLEKRGVFEKFLS